VTVDPSPGSDVDWDMEGRSTTSTGVISIGFEEAGGRVWDCGCGWRTSMRLQASRRIAAPEILIILFITFHKEQMNRPPQPAVTGKRKDASKYYLSNLLADSVITD
jgi:hypothetical protein